MKKLLLLFLVLFTSFIMISCGEDKPEPQPDPQPEPQSEEIVEKDFLDYEGTIYNHDNYTEVDNQNLVGSYHLAKNVQDGVIFHAWNWSYDTIKDNLESIAEAGFSTIQTSPVQQPKEYSQAITGVAKCWWKLYQPLSFSIAENSWLGTKEDLTELCSEANKYGIKIIVDIVANHLAGGTGTSMSAEVEKYEPEIYQQNLIHNDFNMANYNSLPDIKKQVAAPLSADSDYPDLKTEDPFVQERVISLLKECIDCGVSGFRFDATKHIATETDGEYASDFWVNVLGQTTAYGKNKNIDVYYYGEILDGLATGRKMSTYTDKMSVTDNATSANIYRAFMSYFGGDEENWAQNFDDYLEYSKTDDPSKIVLWLESHDTFTAGKSPILSYVIRNLWPLVAARESATALYFSRPKTTGSGSSFEYISQMGEVGTNDYLNNNIVQTNKFHNAFIGAKEEITYQGNFLVLERKREADGKVGVILININGQENEYAYGIKTNLKDGLYIDQISGNRFLVENGLLQGKTKIRVAILYETSQTTVNIKPIISSTVSSNKFYQGQEVSITITASASDNATLEYKIDNGDFQPLTGSSFSVNKDCTVVIKAKTANAESTKTITISGIEDGIEKRAGYVAVAGTSQEYINNHAIYAWIWGGKEGGKYIEVEIVGNVIYVPYTNETNFLLASFAKDTTFDSLVPKNIWHICISQTEDLAIDPNKCYSSTLG